MFFRKKNRQDAGQTTIVEGTAPEVVESPAVSSEKISHKAEETVSASVVAPETANLPAASKDDDAVRLFPGFERDDFEVGFRADNELPALMMRWKDGGEWFTLPPMFNRGILAAIDERESSNDLNRLLRNYGYDVEAVSE